MDTIMPSIGFILLTHRDESQILRLVDRLNALFGYPPIVCHHDFSQSSLLGSRFTSNVRFVQPHVQTRWGTISLVTAMLRALRLLYETSDPGWFYLLSGADYPIRDRDTILRELAASPFDAYIQLKRVDHTRVPERVGDDAGGLESASYSRLAYLRYIARSIPIPSWRHPHRGPAAMHLHLTNPALLKPFHLFSDTFHCYAGGQWFAANSRAAAALLAPENERLIKYFKGRFPPDEVVCPTILGNASNLNICAESKHYIRWEKGHHPRFLDRHDLPAVLASRAHFARKFAHGSPALDVLDTHLGLASHHVRAYAG
jgi:hypothetical protein